MRVTRPSIPPTKCVGPYGSEYPSPYESCDNSHHIAGGCLAPPAHAWEGGASATVFLFFGAGIGGDVVRSISMPVPALPTAGADKKILKMFPLFRLRNRRRGREVDHVVRVFPSCARDHDSRSCDRESRRDALGQSELPFCLHNLRSKIFEF